MLGKQGCCWPSVILPMSQGFLISIMLLGFLDVRDVLAISMQKTKPFY